MGNIGKPIDIIYKEKHVEFRLPNKPEHLCYIDIDDFEDHVENTTCWYIHKGKRASSCFYVRRTLYPSMLTDHLHRYVLNAGEFCLKTSVADHLNRNGLDNRSSNVILTTHTVNMNNRRDFIGALRHGGCAITYIKKRDCYQSYSKKKYIGSSKILDEMKEKIDKYISKLNSGEENERNDYIGLH